MHIGIIHIGSRKYKTFICLFVCGNHNQQFSPTVNSSCPTTSHKPCHHEYIVIKCVECCKFHLLFLPSLFYHFFFVYLYLFFIYRNHYFLYLHFSFFPSLIISTKSIAFCSVRISSFFSISFLFLYKI